MALPITFPAPKDELKVINGSRFLINDIVFCDVEYCHYRVFDVLVIDGKIHALCVGHSRQDPKKLRMKFDYLFDFPGE